MMAYYLHIIINQEAKHKITIKTIVEIKTVVAANIKYLPPRHVLYIVLILL